MLAVAGGEQAGAPVVPQGDGEHAREQVHKAPLLLIEVDQDAVSLWERDVTLQTDSEAARRPRTWFLEKPSPLGSVLL